MDSSEILREFVRTFEGSRHTLNGPALFAATIVSSQVPTMQTRTVSLLLPAMAAVSGFTPAVTAQAATITVNSTLDTIANDNACTLREAIIAANTNAASSDTLNKCVAGDAPVDTIAFHILDADSGCTGSTPKTCTIALSTPLPDITAPVLIDGYTQPNASANTLAIGDDATILIRIDASNISGASGMQLTGGSDGSTVQGLSIVKSGGASNVGYLVKIISSNTTVAGNFIGVEPDGATLSTDHVTFTALWIQGSGNTIGGATAAARNLVANSASDAIDLVRSSNTVQGNYIDIDATGSQAIGNAQTGINTNGTGGHTIDGNVIGTWQANGLVIGSNSFNPGAISVQGNYIGTDAAGTTALSNGNYGILVSGSDGVITIGGSTPGAGNLIHGASVGIYVHGLSTAQDTPVIQGNYIGVGLDGKQPLRSGGSGIFIDPGADSGGLIGGTNAGEGNVIAFNGTSAIGVTSNGVRWAMHGNSMYGNGFGISLTGGSTPTPNDVNDVDTGSNNLQNYPVLSSDVLLSKTSMHISGSLNSEANKTYRIEFFANAGCDLSQHGQGKIFLPLAVPLDVTTSAISPFNAAFGPVALTVPVDRRVITATATDPDGNTSEFSDCSKQDTIFSDFFEGD